MKMKQRSANVNPITQEPCRRYYRQAARSPAVKSTATACTLPVRPGCIAKASLSVQSSVHSPSKINIDVHGPQPLEISSSNLEHFTYHKTSTTQSMTTSIQSPPLPRSHLSKSTQPPLPRSGLTSPAPAPAPAPSRSPLSPSWRGPSLPATKAETHPQRSSPSSLSRRPR